MFWFYYLIYFFVWTLILPFLVLAALTFVAKWRDAVRQKLGFLPGNLKNIYKNKKRIWFHTVSVGEFNAALPVIQSFSGETLVVSTGTKTAQEMAAKKLAREIEVGKVILIYMPWDHPLIMFFSFMQIKPSHLITLETEIWPALLFTAKLFKTPVAVINARLNDSSFAWYKAFSFFFRDVFSSFSLVLSQSATDNRKFIEMGLSRDNTIMLGNIKFALTPAIAPERIPALRESFGYQEDSMVLLAASTHEEEEAVILSIYAELKELFPQLRLIIAPRHPERFDIVEDYINSAANLIPLRFSKIKAEYDKYQEKIRIEKASYEKRGLSLEFKAKPLKPFIENCNDVLLVDTIGDLAKIMAAADIAFVGGTIPDNVGGHNVLEPAVYGIPVLIGVNYFKNVETVEMMEAEGALEVGQTKQELKFALKSLLESDDKRVLMGARALNTMKKNQQILKSCIEKLNDFIGN